MIADHPLKGVGAGNWKLHSAEYYNKYDFDFEKDQLNWLRPHNDYLWVFAEKGIFGFLLFISLFALIFYYIYKILFTDTLREHRIFTLFIFTGLIGYLTVSFFSFPLERINQQIYLALFFSSTIVLHHSGRKTKKPVYFQKAVLYPALAIIAFTVVYSYSMLDMEYKVRQASNALMSNNWKALLHYSQTIPTTFRTLDSEATPLVSYQAQAYSNLGQKAKARDLYEQALVAHPTKINIMNNLGKVYYELGEYPKARDMFLQALVILPNYKEALINLSTTYYKMGKYGKTLNTLKRIPPDQRDETIEKNLKAIKKLISKRKAERDRSGK